MNDGGDPRTKQRQQQQGEQEQSLFEYSHRTHKHKHQTTTHEEYLQVLSTANKLEAIQSKLDSVIDLFGTPIVSNLFSKLCNDCMNLLFDCEFKLEEFRKAEELVWRRVYHDIYRLLKTKRQLFRKDDEYLIESHFMSGICFYSTLIVQLRLKYTITNVHGVINPLNLALVPLDHLLDAPSRSTNLRTGNQHDDFSQGSSSASFSDAYVDQGKDDKCDGVMEAARQWAQQSIYRSLVYMGDIARYLLEFSDCDHRKLAFELYRSAARYQPDHGLPFNQLATLAGGFNYNLDAVCNYMRCCLRPKPFERAEGNMIKIFEMNRKQHEELNMKSHVMKMSEIIASKDPPKEAELLIKAAIVTFLKLASELWFAVGDNLSDDLQNTVVNETHRFFEILREAIELDPIVPLADENGVDVSFRPTPGGPCSLDKPRYVSSTIMYEFCSISIMLIVRRNKNSSPDNVLKRAMPTSSTINDNIRDLVNTLALNLLHYATSKCQKMIISKIQELRVARQQSLSGKNQSLKPPSDSSMRNCSPISSDAASRRALSRLRQKKAATNYSDFHGKHRLSVTRDNDSDLSELEETALSTIDALEISSEMSEGADYQADDLINLDSSSDDGALMRNSISLALLSKPALRPTRSQNYEQDRKTKFTITETCNSLPVPDLLTGDLADISFKTNLTDHDVSGTPSELINERITNSTQSTIESTLTYVYNQTYLPTMKVFFDWLLSDVAIIDSNLDSFTSYHVELLNTVNLLVELKKLIELDDKEASEEEVYRHAYNGPEWIQRYPLSCDFPFVNLSPMKVVHDANIDFGLQRELTDSESGFVTIECIIGFSHALTIFLRNKALKR